MSVPGLVGGKQGRHAQVSSKSHDGACFAGNHFQEHKSLGVGGLLNPVYQEDGTPFRFGVTSVRLHTCIHSILVLGDRASHLHFTEKEDEAETPVQCHRVGT